jgi:hypothetical protein
MTRRLLAAGLGLALAFAGASAGCGKVGPPVRVKAGSTTRPLPTAAPVPTAGPEPAAAPAGEEEDEETRP